MGRTSATHTAPVHRHRTEQPALNANHPRDHPTGQQHARLASLPRPRIRQLQALLFRGATNARPIRAAHPAHPIRDAQLRPTPGRRVYEKRNGATKPTPGRLRARNLRARLKPLQPEQWARRDRRRARSGVHARPQRRLQLQPRLLHLHHQPLRQFPHRRTLPAHPGDD